MLTLWETWPARVLHLIPLASGRTGAWISLCLFQTIWLRRNFGPLLSVLMIPCALVPLCLQPGSVSPSLLPVFSPCTLRKFRIRILSLFSARRLQLSLCFESKMAHLVGVQESRCRDTSVRSFRGYTTLSLRLRQRSVSVVVSCGSLFGYCDGRRPLFAPCGPAQAHGHASASW